jgi:hypothetical protein
LAWNLVLSLLPPRSIPVNRTSQRKASAFFIHICGRRVSHCNSSLIEVAIRTSSQQRSPSGCPCRKFHIHIPRILDGSTKEAISMLAKSASYRTTSSPSKMRYCVMFPLLNFLMFFWANRIYRNIMLYMSLCLTVLLLL